MPSRFERLAAWSYRHRRLALAAWVAVLVGVTAASSAVGGAYYNDHSLPGTESQAVVDTLRAHAPERAGDTIDVVVHDAGGLNGARVDAVLGDLRGLPHVVGVGELAVSEDGTTGHAALALDGPSTDVPEAAVQRIMETAQAAPGLRVELGGDAIRSAEEGEGGAAEGAGMLAALVILVVLFGSLLAASLPLVTAVFAVGITLGLIALASHVANVADYTPPVMMLVGLGVGIDYALLVFSRYRAELLAGADRERAVRRALDTAGRAVFLAGCTVMIALLGLFALGLGALQGVALGVSLTVLVTLVASLTLLPALLGVVGRRIERRVRKSRPDGERWRRWAELVQRRPWPALVVAVLALLALSAPALDMRLGFADAGNDAASTTSRQAYDLLARGFGPGFNGPLVVVADGSGEDVGRELAATPGVTAVTPPAPSPDGAVATILAFPETSPQAAETEALVSGLRERSAGRYLVGGATAAAVDYSDAIADRLPLFVGVVVGLSALLLMVVFRSLLIPLKAALLNLLSIGASLGVLTMAFDDPIEAFIPVMTFAIVFGLSMDYEVFLLSRMHEEWERTRDARRAVTEGLAATGRVITAAAAIMIVVFGAFVLSPERMLQQFGLGLAVAILVDALVIRCLIVPAVMRLLGERAWWMPRWVARRLPRAAIERA